MGAVGRGGRPITSRRRSRGGHLKFGLNSMSLGVQPPSLRRVCCLLWWCSDVASPCPGVAVCGPLIKKEK